MFTRPKDKTILSFSGSPTVALARAVAAIYPGSAMQLDALAFLPHPTDITDITDIAPPRPFASVRFDPLAWPSGSDQRRISGCGIRWLLAGPDSLPLWLCRVCAFVLLRCFSCSHTVLPKEHSLGVIFSPHFPHVNAVFFFNSTCISLLIILVWLCMWRIIKILEPWTATANENQLFEYWAMSSLATDTGENQSAEPYDNDVIRSDWVGPIRLRQLRVSCQNSV